MMHEPINPFSKPQDSIKIIPFIFAVLAILAVIVLVFANVVKAEAYSDTQIVEAIWSAEGGSRATYAYGIRSVKYATIAEARRICFNTVRNNRRRFAKQNKYNDYLEFLASRYCPISAHPKNKFWLPNVRYYLRRLNGI